MPDPVSWLVVESGWRAVDRGGADVGTVERVLGDTALDIFDGLTIRTGVLAKERYVPSERVTEIVEGEVRLDLAGDEVDRLDEYSD
jgi:hypothetical protein